MTSERLEIESAGYLSPGHADRIGAAMAPRPPLIRDIIAGILLLAVGDGESISLEKIHSTFHAMKPHEPVLAGLRFSLTGAVCYSRDIDQAIAHLADGGLLEVAGGSVLVTERPPVFVNYLSGFLANSQIQAVHSASLRFHDRLRREGRGPHRPA